MASPTTDTPTTLATMAPSPTAAGVQQTPDTKGAAPVLFTDIDKVLLMRLYPASDDAQADALAAGQANYDAKVVAAQQEPITPMEPAPGGVSTTGP